MWCDVDVVEFSYFGAPEPAPKEQLYTAIVDDLRGGDLCIGSGSQVVSAPSQHINESEFRWRNFLYFL